jgi:hypothetical protein
LGDLTALNLMYSLIGFTRFEKLGVFNKSLEIRGISSILIISAAKEDRESVFALTAEIAYAVGGWFQIQVTLEEFF